MQSSKEEKKRRVSDALHPPATSRKSAKSEQQIMIESMDGR